MDEFAVSHIIQAICLLTLDMIQRFGLPFHLPCYKRFTLKSIDIKTEIDIVFKFLKKEFVLGSSIVSHI